MAKSGRPQATRFGTESFRRTRERTRSSPAGQGRRVACTRRVDATAPRRCRNARARGPTCFGDCINAWDCVRHCSVASGYGSPRPCRSAPSRTAVDRPGTGSNEAGHARGERRRLSRTVLGSANGRPARDRGAVGRRREPCWLSTLARKHGRPSADAVRGTACRRSSWRRASRDADRRLRSSRLPPPRDRGHEWRHRAKQCRAWRWPG